MVVDFAHTGTTQVPARASVMAAAEALLEYASVGGTDNDRESAHWGSAGQTEAIEMGNRGRLQCHCDIESCGTGYASFWHMQTK